MTGYSRHSVRCQVNELLVWKLGKQEPDKTIKKAQYCNKGRVGGDNIATRVEQVDTNITTREA